jgi:hypothetical protein
MGLSDKLGILAGIGHGALEGYKLGTDWQQKEREAERLNKMLELSQAANVRSEAEAVRSAEKFALDKAKAEHEAEFRNKARAILGGLRDKEATLGVDASAPTSVPGEWASQEPQLQPTVEADKARVIGAEANLAGERKKAMQSLDDLMISYRPEDVYKEQKSVEKAIAGRTTTPHQIDPVKYAGENYIKAIVGGDRNAASAWLGIAKALEPKNFGYAPFRPSPPAKANVRYLTEEDPKTFKKTTYRVVLDPYSGEEISRSIVQAPPGQGDAQKPSGISIENAYEQRLKKNKGDKMKAVQEVISLNMATPDEKKWLYSRLKVGQ